MEEANGGIVVEANGGIYLRIRVEDERKGVIHPNDNDG